MKGYAIGIDEALCVMHICRTMTADEIKSFRTARGMSQSELAEKLGVDQATVSRIERGAPIPKPVELLLTRVMDDAARESVEGTKADAA